MSNEIEEKWIDIPGYDGDYQVSNIGRVRSYKWGIERIKFCAPNESGYPVASLYRNNRLKRHRVHIMVCELFVGPQPSPDHEVNHIDRNPGNPVWTNLEWMTRIQNVHHSIDFMQRGERHCCAKLSDEQVAEIRTRIESGEGQTKLAKEFGVNQSHIWKLVRGQRRGGVLGREKFDVGPRPPIAERHSRAKLKNVDIPVIRTLFEAGKTNVEIAKSYSVSESAISGIRNGRYWKSVH